MTFEEAVAQYYADVKEQRKHVPKIGEVWEQTLYLDAALIPYLDAIKINWLFDGSEIPEGCVFEEEIMGEDFIKRIYIYKGVEDADKV